MHFCTLFVGKTMSNHFLKVQCLLKHKMIWYHIYCKKDNKNAILIDGIVEIKSSWHCLCMIRWGYFWQLFVKCCPIRLANSARRPAKQKRNKWEFMQIQYSREQKSVQDSIFHPFSQYTKGKNEAARVSSLLQKNRFFFTRICFLS